MSIIRKVLSLIRKLLSLEPVAVQAVVRALFVFLATVGVVVTGQYQAQALAAVAAAYALVEAAQAVWTRAKVTPTAKELDKGRHEA